MKIHQMHLKPVPFHKIKTGVKTIELRLNDEKRRRLSIGDTIVFTEAESGETLSAEIVALHPFDSFETLYQRLDLEKCGYIKEELAAASPSDMEIYYSREEQLLCGVLGIEIKLH